jgi:hypothetical protein
MAGLCIIAPPLILILGPVIAGMCICDYFKVKNGFFMDAAGRYVTAEEEQAPEFNG